MQAIRKIVSKDFFKDFQIPEEFGGMFEMILLPIENKEVRKIENRELIIKNEKSFNEMSDKERWEKLGKWSSEDLEECILESNRYIFQQMDEEYGKEDYKVWQK